MGKEVFEVVRERFHLQDPCCYILQGTWPKNAEITAELDGKKLPAKVQKLEMVSAMERFQDPDLLRGEKITASVELPEDLGDAQNLTVYAEMPEGRIRWFSISAKELNKKRGKPQYFIEEQKVMQGTCRIRGWAISQTPVRIGIYDQDRKRIQTEILRTDRVDVEQLYEEAENPGKCGFYVELPQVSGRCLYLVFFDGQAKAVHTVSLSRVVILEEKAGKYLKKGISYWRAQGGRALMQKMFVKAKNFSTREIPYQKWLQKHLPSKAELERQRNMSFAYAPLISVVVPLYKTPEKYLDRLIRSMQEQTYPNWELCLSDGSGADSPLRGILEEYQKADSRIRVVSHEEPLKISENTNAAIGIARGEFIAFADHDDELTPNAMYECVRVLNSCPDARVLYSDEDKMSMDGNKFFQPHFKPDYNPDLLCTVNYICHLFVVKRELLSRVGTLRPEYDGAQDYDFIFRCVEAVKEEEIRHIPKILYHWRCHEDSTAENPESKTYAFEAGKRAIEAHYQRTGVKAEVFPGEFLGLYRTRYLWEEKPLISIIIPNKDHIEDLKRCIGSIEERSAYPNIEYVVVENNSTRPETFAYYEELQKENPRVKVVRWEREFNYSAINNFGVSRASGEYLLLLNNDTEMINGDCLEQLLGYCMRPDVGAVGARLYYEDDTIQHAGVVIGFGGIAGHCFVQQARGTTGYCHRIICAQNYSAVTAACMMVKRSAFEKVGGLCEDLKVAFNDIDFCLRLRRAGYLIVYNPYAELYHYESKSRGLEDTPEKVARFNREIAFFEKRWPDILRDGDPYYNPNLTLNSQDFSLKRI